MSPAQVEYSLHLGASCTGSTDTLDADTKHLGGILCAVAQSLSTSPGRLESTERKVSTDYQLRLVEDPLSESSRELLLTPAVLLGARRDVDRERSSKVRSSSVSCCLQKCVTDALLEKTRSTSGNLIRNCSSG